MWGSVELDLVTRETSSCYAEFFLWKEPWGERFIAFDPGQASPPPSLSLSHLSFDLVS